MELATLARGALVAIGNDTGPMHLAAAAGCPSVVLYSHESDPALCGQRGACVTYIRRPSLNDVGVGDVLDTIAAQMERIQGGVGGCGSQRKFEQLA
jgi:ADP-heptose:LPS heptosyltransferase